MLHAVRVSPRPISRAVLGGIDLRGPANRLYQARRCCLLCFAGERRHMTANGKVRYERLYVSYSRRDGEYRCHQPDQAAWGSHRTWFLEYVSRVGDSDNRIIESNLSTPQQRSSKWPTKRFYTGGNFFHSAPKELRDDLRHVLSPIQPKNEILNYCQSHESKEASLGTSAIRWKEISSSRGCLSRDLRQTKHLTRASRPCGRRSSGLAVWHLVRWVLLCTSAYRVCSRFY